MSSAETYNADFYQAQRDGSAASARRIVPDVMQWLAPRSVVDVGCGVGTWLAEYARHGAEVQGLDGTWVQPAQLFIDAQKFKACDLTHPPALSQRYDLAQSLEVAEHLDAAFAAEFVRYLTTLSDFVLFSAAAPLQGGDHHVNEQWPGYWKTLFEAQGYRIFDAFRRRYWEDPQVEYWYAQNMFLFVRAGVAVPADLRSSEGFVIPERVVHPRRLRTRKQKIGGLVGTALGPFRAPPRLVDSVTDILARLTS